MSSIYNILAQIDKYITDDKRPFFVIGDFMVDRYIYVTPDRISAEGPFLIYKNLCTEEYSGGAGNVVACIAKIGIPVMYYGRYNCPRFDYNGAECIDIGETYPRCADGAYTVKERICADDRVLSRIDYDVETEFVAEHMNLRYKLNCGNVSQIIVADYNKGITKSDSFYKSLDECSNSFDIPVIVDSSNYSNIVRHDNMLVKVNEKQAMNKSYFQDGTPILYESIETADDISLGADVVITAPYGSALFYEYYKKFYMTAPETHVVDVTGAGDVYLAWLSAANAAGCLLEDCVKIATLVASYSVSKFGCYQPSLTEVMECIA